MPSFSFIQRQTDVVFAAAVSVWESAGCDPLHELADSAYELEKQLVGGRFTASPKNCADLYLSELRQISTDFNNFFDRYIAMNFTGLGCKCGRGKRKCGRGNRKSSERDADMSMGGQWRAVRGGSTLGQWGTCPNCCPPPHIQKLADCSDVIFEVPRCSKMHILWGSAPDPAEGAYSAPQTP